MKKIEYRIAMPNTIDMYDILNVLKEVDSYFVPTLSSRVDLSDFAKKITTYATLFLAISDERIIGYNAVYINFESKIAYATSLAVLPRYQTFGLIGVKLVQQAIEYAKNYTSSYELCIRGDNQSMLNWYLRKGFEIVKEDFFANTTVKRLSLRLKY